MKHVSGAQLTGTRACGEERCQAASRISGGSAPPGKPYPGAASGLAAPARARAAASFPLRREAPPRGSPASLPAALGRLQPGAQGPCAPRRERGEQPCGGALPSREGQRQLALKEPEQGALRSLDVQK